MSDLKAKFPKMLTGHSLAQYTTFQVGGPADYFYKLTDQSKLPELIKAAEVEKIPYFILAGGSNTLFHDKGFRGLIIKNELDQITVDPKTQRITAESGVTTAKFMHAAVTNNLTGFEGWMGLPGTIGGAVRGNAGCNGLETKDILLNATLYNPKTGKIHREPNKYFQFKYRNSKLKKEPEVVIQAVFQLQTRHQTFEEQKQLMQSIRAERIAKQPFGLSIGSFFKNPAAPGAPTTPENPHAQKSSGQLIDEAGLKGKKIGKAQISEKHANFMLNLGGATAENIKELGRLARQTVEDKFGITLKEEVQILSETGPDKL